MKETLKKLIELDSPSGFEFMAHPWIKEAFGKYVKGGIWTDGIGNLYLRPFPEDPEKTTVMLSAHLDEIGMMLSAEKDGSWRFSRLGGIDLKVLMGTLVKAVDPENPENSWTGVISKMPIHLETSEERKSVPDLKDLTINFGGVTGPTVGMPVVPEKHIRMLGEDLMVGPGLDDKSGCAIILEMLKDLPESLSVNLVIVLMAQEETGLRGATVAAKAIQPDISIDLDVSFAGPRGNLAGEISLGKGPIISLGPDKDYKLSHKLLKGAKVPVQTEVTGAGGTNTCAIQENATNCRCVLVSIPSENMHTPVEVVSVTDLVNTKYLLLEFLKDLS